MTGIASGMIVGSDFDNTIVDYNRLFFQVALERKLIDPAVPADKTSVRDYVRELEDGEVLWQKLQAEVYGPRINEAFLFPGVERFLESCIEFRVPLYVVSHKTRYSRQGSYDLRAAALGFMHGKGLFNDGSYGLSLERVFFADTRNEKSGIIKSLGCSVFLDDLIEVFEEPEFPHDVLKYLFAPGEFRTVRKIRVVRTWQDFSAEVFGGFSTDSGENDG